MDKKDCSNCGIGDLDKHTNVAGCPFYAPKKNNFCAMWLSMTKDERNLYKQNKSEVKTND